jgi:hypothetical protein
MAQDAGQSSDKGGDIKKREPYCGERKVKVGNYRADRRKLRQMIAAKPGKKGNA